MRPQFVTLHLHGERDALVTEGDVEDGAKFAAFMFAWVLTVRAIQRAVQRRLPEGRAEDAKPALAGETVEVER